MKKIISFDKSIEFPTMIGEITAIALDHNLTFVDESNITGNFKITGRYKMTEASRLEEDFSHQLPAEIILPEKLDLETAKIDVDDFYYEIENEDTMICHIDLKVEGVELIDEQDLTEEDTIPTTIDEDFLLEVSDTNQQLNKSIENEDSTREKASIIEEKTPIIVEETPAEVTEKPQIIKEGNNHPVSTPIQEKEPSNVRECDGDLKEEMSNYMKIDESSSSLNNENAQKEANQEVGVGSLFSSFKDSDETFATYSIYILRQEETIEMILEKYKVSKEELEKYNDLTNLSIGTKLIIPSSNE